MNKEYRGLIMLLWILNVGILWTLILFFEEKYWIILSLSMTQMGFLGLNIGLKWLDRHPYNTTEDWQKLISAFENFKKCSDWNDKRSDILDIKMKQTKEIHKAFNEFYNEILRICTNPECSYDSNLQREFVQEAMVKVAKKIQAIFQEV